MLMSGFTDQYYYVKLKLDWDFEFDDSELCELESLAKLSNQLKEDINNVMKFCVFKKCSDTYQQGMYLSRDELTKFII